MNIDLKILHLHRPLCYVEVEPHTVAEEKTLDRLTSQFGECLLVVEEEGFSAMTADGPKLLGAPRIEAVYRAAANGVSVTFSLAPGDYVFFQWRAEDAPQGPGLSPRTIALLEEVVRETWWQRLPCVGPWYIRLVAEDDSTAIQALKELRPAAH